MEETGVDNSSLETLKKSSRGRGDEHHRLRRSWTSAASTASAHHRPRMAPREASTEVLSVGDEVTAKILKFDAEKNRCRWASSSSAKTRGSSRAIRRARASSARSPTSPIGAFVEIEAASRAWCTSRDGLDQQERASREGGEPRRRSKSGSSRSTRTGAAFARHEAAHAEPVEEFAMNQQEGRHVRGTINRSRLRRVHRLAGHRRPRAPPRPSECPAKRP